MKNFCLVIEYIGTNYCGFQKQINGISIQKILEDAILSATNEKSTTYPSGRTDAGVHALAQVVNFHSNTTIPAEKLSICINHYLPDDIRVKQSFEVEDDFHARKSAKMKTYIYKIFNGETLSVFDENRVLHIKAPFLDFDLLNQGAKLFIGEHDFSSFVASNHSTKSSIRTIFYSQFSREGNYIVYTVSGNGFLYNMVRIMVGTLLDVGMGKRSLQSLKDCISGNSRQLAGKTVSPNGLYLKEVIYK